MAHGNLEVVVGFGDMACVLEFLVCIRAYGEAKLPGVVCYSTLLRIWRGCVVVSV